MSRAAMRAAVQGGARPEVDHNTLTSFLRVGARRLTLQNSEGQLTQHGRLFQEVANQLGVNGSVTIWRHGTRLIGRDTEGVLIDGTRRVLRRWDAINNREIQTPNGDSYYRQFHDEFLVNLPAFRHVPGKPKSNDRGELYIPIIMDKLLEMHPRIRDLRRVPANAPAGHQQQWIREAIDAYLAAQPRDANGDVRLIEFEDSDVHYTWDQHRGTTFDELVAHVENADPLHPNVVHAILNRPLQGIPICPDEMYDKQGISPIAWEDTRSRGGCILNQLLLVLNKRVKVKTSGGQAGGKDTRRRDWVPMYTMEELSKKFQESFDLLYPGRTATIYGPKTLTTTVAERRELEAAKELHRKGLGKRPMEEPVDESVPVRAAPYDLGDWRELGATCNLIQHFCERVGVALRILHSDRLIQEFNPPNWRPDANKPIVCINVWSDHGFIYEKPHSKSAVCQMKVVKPEYLPPTRVASKDDDEDKVNYSEMEQYTAEAFDAAFAAKPPEAKVFYSIDLKDVREYLQSKKVTFKSFYGSTPSLVTSLSVNVGKKKFIKIRGITPEHRVLDKFCSTFNEITGHTLVYKGESMPHLMHKAVNELLVKKRMHVSVEDVVKLLERQEKKCNCCGDPLTKRREVDHIRPLAQGGGNELDNLQLLCLECHATKTEREEQTSGTTNFHTLESQLSPHLVEVFHKSPKPMQFSGAWREFPSHVELCKCVDVAGCRSNAIFEYEHGIPIFSPLDRVERIFDEEGFMVRDLKDYAVIWVNCPDVDLSNRKQAAAAFPWTGARWYVLGSVIYMLQTGAITTDNLVYGIQPSRLLNPKLLEEAFNKIHDVFDRTLEAVDEEDSVSDLHVLKKRAVLSAIGLWNNTERLAWKVVRSQYVEDCPAPPKRREYVGDGLWDFKYSQLICDNKSMRGIGQIALDMEQVYVDKILRSLRRMPNVKTYGALVDCVFYTNWGFDNPVADFVDQHTFPSGKAMFKIKVEEAYKVPRHPLANQERSMKLEPLKPWRKLYEDSGVDHVEALRNFVQALRENKGGMILGPGGVGKTELIKNLVRSLKADNVKVHVCAVRHAAKALLPNGKTLAHLLHKYKDAREFWLIIDESSEIPLSMWADIAKWKFIDVYFVVVGDFAGQLCPISDRWKDAMDRHGIQDGDFMHSLVNGLQIHLSTCRRLDKDDWPHFALTQSLYKKAFYKPGEPVDQDLFDEELRATLAELRPRFPMPPGGLADVTLTLSHWMRINVNTVKNDILKDCYAEKRWMPWDEEARLQGFTMQPQACWIWKGLEVMGCTRKNMGNEIVNGFSYMVTDFDDEKVQLKVITKVEVEEEDKEEEDFADDEADDAEEVEEAIDAVTFQVSHDNFMKHFRLSFAIPVCYSQGRTYRDKTLLLVDTESQHYSMRHLIVAVSRVTNSKNLWIAPEGYSYTIADKAKAIEEAREPWQQPQQQQRPASSNAMEVDDVQNLAYINRRSEADDAADVRLMELMMEEDDA